MIFKYNFIYSLICFKILFLRISFIIIIVICILTCRFFDQLITINLLSIGFCLFYVCFIWIINLFFIIFIHFLCLLDIWLRSFLFFITFIRIIINKNLTVGISRLRLKFSRKIFKLLCNLDFIYYVHLINQDQLGVLNIHLFKIYLILISIWLLFN